MGFVSEWAVTRAVDRLFVKFPRNELGRGLRPQLIPAFDLFEA
jgi:hypothetical protein